MRGTRGADHWLVKGCMFFDATIKEITTSLQGGSYPPGLGADQRETYPSTKSTLKYIWNNFKKARRAMEITVLDVVSRETRKHVSWEELSLFKPMLTNESLIQAMQWENATMETVRYLRFVNTTSRA